MELSKSYDPKQTEEKIYRLWEESGCFAPEAHQPRAGNPNQNKSYTIVLPPPNVTGELHMGHALNTVIQDILIRKKRMEGFKTLWVPGTDHAGIATQAKVEKELKKQGKTRFDLGKEEFIKRVWDWKDKYGNIILSQLKRIGASCDWSKTRFTMDGPYQKAVETAFLNYYKKGLIYKGKRAVNWCTRCGTSLSDLEIEYKEEPGQLWFIRYPLVAPPSGATNSSCSTKWSNCITNITVATTRPETMLGDTAVAVNPKDKRYKKLVGQKVVLPIVNKEIPVIEDRLIDSKFGTGAVKVTPAHDLADYEIGQRHNLEAIQIIDEKGRMTENCPLPYHGLKVTEARQKIVEELKTKNLIEKIEPYTHNIARCYRCDTVLEPLLSEQWFLKMDKLAKGAIKAVRSGKVKFSPKKWEKVYFDWLANIKDWCISRQLWWGHKIPLQGVDDVLDTWFSSALWPFATLGWPAKTKDLKTFYPTQVLSTARDIINLWVARMIFSGLEFMGREPFSTVLIHPTVLTKDGKRMSKSLGTGIDPMLLIEKYGADAVRFGIAYQLTGNQDIKFSEDNIIMGRKFCNKVWNASRFVLMQTQSIYRFRKSINNYRFTKSIIMGKLNKTIKSVNKDLDNYQFGRAAHTLYDFFWHDFCDKFIEESKNQNDEKTQATLFYVLLQSLKLLHPFIPFITEEIYQQLPLEDKKSLIIEEWPLTSKR